MSYSTFILVLLAILLASIVFYKLSQIRWRGRCLVPMKWRIIGSLVILVLIPVFLLFGLAILILIAIGLVFAFIAFVFSGFRMR